MAEMDPVHIMELLGAAALFIFGNFLAIRGALNGLKATVKSTNDEVGKLNKKADSLAEKMNENTVKLVRMEDKLESHAEWIRRLESTCSIRHPEGR